MRFFELLQHGWMALLEGLSVTLVLIGLSFSAGLVLSIPLAFALQSRRRWKRCPAEALVFFFRGTPLLVQLFLVYYGLSQFRFVQESFLWDGFLESPFWCGILTLTVNAASYLAIILRGGMRAVPHGQIEAARAFGFTKGMRLRRIILPQAFFQSIPFYSNEMIWLVKASALASTITVMELTGRARTLIAETYSPMEYYIMAGVLYLILNGLLAWMFRVMERQLQPWRLARQDT